MSPWRACAVAATGVVAASCATLLGDDFEIVTSATGTAGGGAMSDGGAGGASASGGGDAGGTGGSGGIGGGGIGPGPKIVMSTPADGDDQASLNGYALVYFDRVVSIADAAGEFSLRSALHDTDEPCQVLACPDADPKCVGVLFPAVFLDPNDHLFGATAHTLTVSKDFPDTDGVSNNLDQTIDFTTFTFNPNFFDDTVKITDELGGLAYDPVDNAIFLVGEGPDNSPSGPVVRRISLDGSFQPTGAETQATPAVTLAYGLDYLPAPMNRLAVAGTYANTALLYQVTLTSLILDKTLMTTNLSSPNDVLDQVEGTANVGTRLYFGMGAHLGGGSVVTGLLEWDSTQPPAMGWSIALADTGLFDSVADFYIAAGKVGGQDFIFLAQEEKILKIRQSDKTVVNTHNGDDYLGAAQLRVDSAGRLYVGTDDELAVYDTTGTTGFTELARRDGLDGGRFDIREAGNVATIYYAPYRDAGQIGATVISF